MKQIIKGSIKLRWTKTKTNFLMEWPHITKQNLVPLYTQLIITPETIFTPFSILLSKSLLRSSHYHNTNTGVRNARRINSVNNEKYPTINLGGGKCLLSEHDWGQQCTENTSTWELHPSNFLPSRRASQFKNITGQYYGDNQAQLGKEKHITLRQILHLSPEGTGSQNLTYQKGGIGMSQLSQLSLLIKLSYIWCEINLTFICQAYSEEHPLKSHLRAITSLNAQDRSPNCNSVK